MTALRMRKLAMTPSLSSTIGVPVRLTPSSAHPSPQECPLAFPSQIVLTISTTEATMCVLRAHPTPTASTVN